VARPYSTREQESVAQLAGQASVALTNSRLVGRLERLSQLTRAALDGIVEAIRLVDPNGTELLVNASMRQLDDELGLHLHGSLYGAESAEFAARTTDPDAYLAELREMQANPERSSRTEWELEESGRVFERYTAPIRDSLGMLIGRVLFLREMTAERGAERLQAELISVVSHELRGPLTSMLGFTNVLLEEGLGEVEWSMHVETVRSEIVRLLAIVDDLLDFQRVAEGGFALSFDRFDLFELIEEQVSAHANASELHELMFEPVHDRLLIEADRQRIAQVLANLISNAIKYSPQGGPVRISAERGLDVVRVSVSDSGIGIRPEHQDKVFTKFFRVDSEDTAHIRGLGLGLALCRELVVAHGGTIGCDSAPGAGAIFWFELPAS
jgi:signal transduction histidine kinase